jgi:hypothetical protein
MALLDAIAKNLVAGIIAAIVFSPMAYKFTNRLLTDLSPKLSTIGERSPTILGYGLHAVVFSLILAIYEGLA